MRTLLLALMIALLPIRGWLGDAMAVEMVKHSLPAVAVATAEPAASALTMATEAHCHEAMEVAGSGAMDHTGMAGHADHASAASHDGGSGDGDDHGGTGHQGCGTCTACQVCHTVAVGGMPLVDTVHGAPQAAPAAHAARFASAEPAQGLKPPIS
ncbi:hypothetical protein DBV14_04040 [Variovorax sp. KBW07]|uniref:hypothetical protein n=1 Tax=Variovorax sp. KBW07 TaxID=2153358 RepID=UPI000F55BC4F|nr:hypothetical protein [Variovorax sp. KBW07]RQO62703.1 hypothetical protein DBV14_04040 [Variovorax sp. KBW07]